MLFGSFWSPPANFGGMQKHFSTLRIRAAYDSTAADEIILFWPWRRRWWPTLASYGDATSADVDPKLQNMLDMLLNNRFWWLVDRLAPEILRVPLADFILFLGTKNLMVLVKKGKIFFIPKKRIKIGLRIRDLNLKLQIYLQVGVGQQDYFAKHNQMSGGHLVEIDACGLN